MDDCTIGAGYGMGFEGDVVFGGRAVAAGVVGGPSGYTTDGGKIKERILLLVTVTQRRSKRKGRKTVKHS